MRANKKIQEWIMAYSGYTLERWFSLANEAKDIVRKIDKNFFKDAQETERTLKGLESTSTRFLSR